MVTTIINTHSGKFPIIIIKDSKNFVNLSQVIDFNKILKFTITRKVFKVKNGVKVKINHLPLTPTEKDYIEIIIIT